jgi:hypothetical protein
VDRLALTHDELVDDGVDDFLQMTSLERRLMPSIGLETSPSRPRCMTVRRRVCPSVSRVWVFFSSQATFASAIGSPEMERGAAPNCLSTVEDHVPSSGATLSRGRRNVKGSDLRGRRISHRIVSRPMWTLSLRSNSATAIVDACDGSEEEMLRQAMIPRAAPAAAPRLCGGPADSREAGRCRRGIRSSA